MILKSQTLTTGKVHFLAVMNVHSGQQWLQILHVVFTLEPKLMASLCIIVDLVLEGKRTWQAAYCFLVSAG